MTENEVKILERQAELAKRAAAASETFQTSMTRLANAEAAGAAARANLLSNALESETSSQMLDESRDGIEASTLFGRQISGGQTWKPRLAINGN